MSFGSPTVDAAPFSFDLDELGLSVRQVGAAAGRLASSPVYALVRDHLTALSRETAVLTSAECESQVSLALTQATTELIHALVVTSGIENDDHHRAIEESLLPRTIRYLRNHLSDPGLDAETVARAHGVTSAQLRRAWAPMQMSVDVWITGQRISAARSAMRQSDPSPEHLEALAFTYGFRSSRQFSQAFRTIIGVTPEEWLREVS